MSQRACVIHGEPEESAFWYYRDAAEGLEYVCADAYAQLPENDRRQWRFLPDSAG